MKNLFTYKKFIFATLLMTAMNLAYGAFTGNVDDHKNKFCLKNLNSLGKIYSLSSLRTNTFRFTGSQDINQQNSGGQVQVQSMIRMENGNTTYVYPYKYTVKVPKFKTPTPPTIR
jgi:hypothetical protein